LEGKADDVEEDDKGKHHRCLPVQHYDMLISVRIPSSGYLSAIELS
jgi:hypothetical protein